MTWTPKDEAERAAAQYVEMGVAPHEAMRRATNDVQRDRSEAVLRRNRLARNFPTPGAAHE